MNVQALQKDKWEKLREVVRNTYNFNQTWQEIINSFKLRVENFYFKPIKKIKEPNDLQGEGFTILTIQCALIEMFASFKFGKIFNHYKKRTGNPNFEYKKSTDCFIPFLHSESIFQDHFFSINTAGQPVLDQPFTAMEFYDKVRCGLMHEARTKGEWIVNAKRKYIGNETTFIIRNISNNTISVDRTILNKQLETYFQQYLHQLTLATAEGNNLRRLFARKLDHLYDIPPAPNDYDWWEDR